MLSPHKRLGSSTSSEMPVRHPEKYCLTASRPPSRSPSACRRSGAFVQASRAKGDCEVRYGGSASHNDMPRMTFRLETRTRRFRGTLSITQGAEELETPIAQGG